MVPSSEGVRGDLQGVLSSPSQPLYHTCQCQASSLHLSGSRPDGLEAGHVPAPLGQSVCLCLPTVCSAQAGLVESASFDQALIGSGGGHCGHRKSGSRSFVPVDLRTTQTSAGVELAVPATRAKVPSRPRDPPASHVDIIQRLVQKAGFSKAVARVTAADLRHSTAALYKSKWSRFLSWCDRWGVDLCKASVPQRAEFFFFFHQELGLSVPAVKGYRGALNHVFSLTGMLLATSIRLELVSCSAVFVLLSPSSWPLTNILPGRHLFYLFLRWPRGLVSCTDFPFVFVTHTVGVPVPSPFFLTLWLRTQSPSVPDSCFEEFLVSSLDDFIGGD